MDFVDVVGDKEYGVGSVNPNLLGNVQIRLLLHLEANGCIKVSREVLSLIEKGTVSQVDALLSINGLYLGQITLFRITNQELLSRHAT